MLSLPSPLQRISLAACLFAASIVRADIEFVGILATNQSSHYALGDTTTGKTDWVTTGGTFAGYTLVAYEPKIETIVLRRDGAELRIKLKNDAKVKEARLELTGAISF